MVASHVGRDIGLRVRGSVLRELTALREENDRLREALTEVIAEANEASSYTKGDLADIAKAALTESSEGSDV